MMLKLCVAVLASTTAAQGSIDLLDFSQLGCIRAVPEDIALVEFSLENSTLLSNNLGGQGGKHPIDYEDPQEIRFAQVVTVTRKPSVEMTQASSPVALRAAPPRRRRRAPPPPPPPPPRRRRRAPPPPLPALLLTCCAPRGAGVPSLVPAVLRYLVSGRTGCAIRHKNDGRRRDAV